MKQIMKVWTYVLVCMFVGSITSCNDDPTPDSDTGKTFYMYLDGAYREAESQRIFVFDGNGTFKSYNNAWLYTADADSYSYGTWEYKNSTLTLTYTGKYENGELEQNFYTHIKDYAFKNYIVTDQSFIWTTEDGLTSTFKKFVRASVEQYLRYFLIGKCHGAAIGAKEEGHRQILECLYEIKADGTFIRTLDSNSLKEYGTWSISQDNLNLRIEGYYDTNYNKIPYPTLKTEDHTFSTHTSSSFDPTAIIVLYLYSEGGDVSLDQGGGSMMGSTFLLIPWTKIND